jgi:hypothetical protein
MKKQAPRAARAREGGKRVPSSRLAGDGEHVANLRLAGAKLAVNLGDGAGLDAACAARGVAGGEVGTPEQP